MTGLLASVHSCLLRKFAGFRGRSGRPEFWWFLLAFSLGAATLRLIGIALLYHLYLLALALPLLAAGWRRLQDTGRPGWLVLILPAPTALALPTATPGQGLGGLGLVAMLSVAQLVLLILYGWWLSRPSQPGANRYGPPPGPAAPGALA